MTCNRCGKGKQMITVIGFLCPVCGDIAPLNFKELDVKFDLGLLRLVKVAGRI